jgi:hypothetical protein
LGSGGWWARGGWRRSCWRLLRCWPWHYVDDGSDCCGCIARRDCVVARVPVAARSHHVRPQVDERDDAFVAVELWSRGSGWLRICRHGLEKVMYWFPPSAADVDVKGLNDQKFSSAVWRAGDAARDSGEKGGWVGGCDGVFGIVARIGCVRVRVTLLLLLQLLSVMPSMSLLQCRAWCRGGQTRFQQP